ncbi:MAG: acyl--CoA ligase [Actinomycetota bacterium]|nr:acyl--CoA ligase [Actinomycetota bacterium]
MSEQTLAHELRVVCERFHNRLALCSEESVLSYGSLRQAALRLAGAYRRLGIAPGERIVCWLPNCPEFVVAALAAWELKAVHVGADKELTTAEVSALLEQLGAAAIIFSAEDGRGLSAARSLREAHPRMHLIVSGEQAPEGCYRLPALLSSKLPTPDVGGDPPSPRDPAVIFLTSGTSSAPKAVVRYHGQLLEAWRWMGQALKTNEEDVHLVQLPLSYGFGFGQAVAGMLTGGRLVLVRRFSPRSVLSLIDRENVTVLHGSPAHFRLLVNSLDRVSDDVSSLRIGVGSGASFPPALLERIFDDLGMTFVLAYGSSEGLGCLTADREEMLRGSVGRPPAEWVRILGPDGSPQPAGEVGEIALRKLHGFEYWGDKERSDGPLLGRWCRTGDLGKLDDEGYLYVLGSVKHQINRGGIGVDPGEVEAVLSYHPDLVDAAVVGLPDPVLGEIVCACVVPRADKQAPGLSEVREFLGDVLAKHKLPEELCILTQIPRTARGKVDRGALASQARLLTAHRQNGSP